MKKFITAAFMLALPSTQTHAAAPLCEFQAHAPDSHVVTAGDNLWDIAEKFLQNSWCWPKVWDQNRESVNNPHKIYPGQTIYFDRQRGKLSLLDNKVASSTKSEKLSPRIRAAPMQAQAVPVIPAHLLELVRTMPILNNIQMTMAAKILAFSDGRNMGMKNDAVYVTGPLEGQQHFHVVRPNLHIKDPETGVILAYAGKRVGVVRLVSAATDAQQAHHFTVTDSNAELLAGDLLLPAMPTKDLSDFPPLHASAAISGRIASIFRDGLWAGPYDLVAINRGHLHGLSAGGTLSVVKQAKIKADNSRTQNNLTAPMQTIATLLVTDVTDQVAFAMVMRAIDGINIGDLVVSSEGAAK
jgi:hypothetical protein